MTCDEPIGTERLVAYWANELAVTEVDAIDEHVFGCDACAFEAGRVSRVVQAFRGAIPPVVTRADIEALRARGHVIRENDFAPGMRTPVVFEEGVDYLIHRLGGLELEGAERVDVTVRNESGETLFFDSYAPFDRERGQVLIACQRHFQAYSDPNIVFDVHDHNGDATTVATFAIPHLIG